MGRPAEAIIYMDALRHNFHTVRCLTRARITCVVKSNAYGHGALRVARELEKEGADAFAVACIEEAIELREGGILCPIILLEGCFESNELVLVEQYQLTTLLQNTEQVDMFLAHKAKKPLDLWLKIDSGMHRLGFNHDVFRQEYQRIMECPHVKSIVLATHFSCADNPDNPYTQQQIQNFRKTIQGMTHKVSLSSSASILYNYNTHDDWVRPGIMLTGVSPLPSDYASGIQLKPVMKLTANIIAVKQLPANSPVGYGNTFITTRPTRIGIVAIGYGDGYPQHLPTGTPVIINGKSSHLIGRVSMDSLGVDLTQVPGACIGTPVTLWGPELSVSDIAHRANMIPYALMTGVQRVKRKYIDQ